MAAHLNMPAALSDQIAEKLRRFSRSVELQNRKGLFDLTRQAEDVVCTLLNLAFGWELVNLNRQQPNCPAVDLADETRGICVQVTAVRGAAKTRKTLDQLQKYFGGAYRRLIMFYLLEKPKTIPNLAENDCQVELLDVADLTAALSRASVERQKAALAFLHAMEDAGILDPKPDLAQRDQWFTPGSTLLEDPLSGQAVFSCQKERVRLTAFLPRSPGQRLCCKIEFARRDTCGSHITFDQEIILERLLPGHHTALEQRGFAAAVDVEKDFAALQLGNSRYFTDIDTARQLCSLLDQMQEEYAAGQARLAQQLGTASFSVSPDEDWSQPLCRMPPELWDALWMQAQAHDAVTGQGPWDLFDGCAPLGVIRLLKQPGRSRSPGILAEILRKEDGQSVVVLWRRGTIPGCPDWDGFTDGRKWRADQTLEFLLTRWLPYLAASLYEQHYPDTLLNRLRLRAGQIPTREAYQRSLLTCVHSLYK